VCVIAKSLDKILYRIFSHKPSSIQDKQILNGKVKK
jgi:hypothetical protein